MLHIVVLLLVFGNKSSQKGAHRECRQDREQCRTIAES